MSDEHTELSGSAFAWASRGSAAPRGSIAAGHGLPTVTVTRRLRFSAAHRLHNPMLSAEENRRLFGRDNNPGGHGHNYVRDLSVTGEIDDPTGYVLDLGELKRIVEEEILDRLDHRPMNVDVPFLHDVHPTCENVIVACWRVLDQRLQPGRLTRLRLDETENNYVDYNGQ